MFFMGWKGAFIPEIYFSVFSVTSVANFKMIK
jgi:hypothetical protein